MLFVTRWVGIASRTYSVGVPPPPTSALYRDFAAAKIANDLLRAHRCFRLGSLDTTCALPARRLDRPSLWVLCYETFDFGHYIVPQYDMTTMRIKSKMQPLMTRTIIPLKLLAVKFNGS